MARDCLKEEEFLDRNKDLIYEDMEVMTDFELHRFCQGYKVSSCFCSTSLFARRLISCRHALSNSTNTPSKTTNGCQQERSPSCKSCYLDFEKKEIEFSFSVNSLKYSIFLKSYSIRWTSSTSNWRDRRTLRNVKAFVMLTTMILRLPFSVSCLDPLMLRMSWPANVRIVLSTRAGGLGLNLTAANTVMFYDCDYKWAFPPSFSALPIHLANLYFLSALTMTSKRKIVLIELVKLGKLFFRFLFSGAITHDSLLLLGT